MKYALFYSSKYGVLFSPDISKWFIMLSIVFAEVEIDGNRLHFTSLRLDQKFNHHHEFTIKVDPDVLEASDNLSLEKAKALMGKYAVIRFLTKTGQSSTTSLEFKGIVFEVAVQSSTNGSELTISGFSPTILLEDGQGYASFLDMNLTDIVGACTTNFDQSQCGKEINPGYGNPLKYITRYKESNFHFLNRLSSIYGELFYYDGKSIVFGQPAVLEFIEVVSGVDISNMRLRLAVEQLESWNYAYTSADDQYITTRGNDISGLDPLPAHVVNISNELYAELDDVPIIHPVETTRDAENLVLKAKESKAAGLVVLKGTSNYADMGIGRVAEVKISRASDRIREDFGTFLITSITHNFSQGGSYYNNFEGLSGWVRGIPVKNIIQPLAESQYAWVSDNKDPDKKGRVKVKMQWQTDGEETPWIWVMAPDAGSGKSNSAGGGLAVLPEVGDRVLLGFIYNNPDRPVVMGSLFNGKTAPDGKLRCLTGRQSTAKVCINDADGSINIEDGDGHKIGLDGAGKISITADTEILFKVGSSEIKIEPAKITIKATDVKVDATTADIQGSSKAVIKTSDSTFFKADGTAASGKGVTMEVEGTASAKLKGAMVEVNATGATAIKGAMVQLNG